MFDGAESADVVMKQVEQYFTFLSPDGEVATRRMDSHEIDETREEYCVKMENDVPRLSLELLDAIETAKRIKKEAEDRLNAMNKTISDLAAQVKACTKEYLLNASTTIRFALDGHFCFYSWVDGVFQLVKVEKIPEWDKRSLWAQESKNRDSMKELFGYDFPEVEKPSDCEEYDNEDF